MSRQVTVVIGTGGMGLAIARRLGSGKRVFLADFSKQALDNAEKLLSYDGYDVECHQVNVSEFDSVETLARAAAAAGPLGSIVHTAGVSGASSNAKQIYNINLLGTANVIDAFLPFATLGTSLVCIASMAGYVAAASPELEKHLATAPRDKILNHDSINVDSDDAWFSYAMSKKGNQLRVQAAAPAWGTKGARVNSVSPGLVSTAMGHRELKGPMASQVQAMVSTAPAQRAGTPDDISSAVAFLCGPEASFVTGIDLLVDGGAFAAQRWNDVGKSNDKE